MKVIKNLFQCSNIGVRIYIRKKTRHLYNQRMLMSQHQGGQQEKDAFNSIFTEFINCIVSHPGISAVPDLEKWFKKLCTYNLFGGKAARGMSVVTAYQMLEKPENMTEESMKLARILGWCVEMFQSYLVIMDDIMDTSTTRRGQPCWYMLPEVGTSCAINDGILLYNSLLFVLRTYFGERATYTDMLNSINETLFFTAIGQHLDLKSSKLTNEDYLKMFTPKRYLTIVKYKTAYYSYDLPIRLGSLLVGKLDGKTRKQVQDLSIDLGTLFQIQDDYLDCYGDESLTGKVGTDIQEGKCSWLAVSALQRCSEPQRIVFKACYGSKEPAHIERIKQLYNQLKIPQLYKETEEKYYDDILDKIKVLPTEEWKRLFDKMLGITYQRKM